MLKILSLAAVLSLSPDAEWQPLIDQGPVRTYKLNVDGSKHHAYRADGRFCASQTELLELFENVEGFPRWLPRTQAVEALDDDGFSKRIYVVSDAPWPLRSRDMVYRVSLQTASDGASATVNIDGEPDAYPEQRGRVRLESARGLWQIQMDGEVIDAQFMLHLDVGHTPAFLAQRSLHTAVRDAITNLQALYPCSG